MLQFVPVGDATPTSSGTPPATGLEVPVAAVEPAKPWDARVSLFGDLER